ncbi:hypothetical protein C8Q80DRAFT_1167940, partial [Daedaleopsis nitida]
VFVINHVSGTVAMGKEGDSKDMLNHDLNVKGLKGLHVVDATAFVYVPFASLPCRVGGR